MRLVHFIPALVIAAMVMLFGLILADGKKPQESPLLGKNLPEFSLPAIGEGRLESRSIKGPAIINFFASWCVSCRYEHPALLELRQGRKIRIYGIAWKDKEANAAAYLKEQGNPYSAVGLDETGKTAISFGLTGAPESYVLDSGGKIVAVIKEPLSNEMAKKIIDSFQDSTTYRIK